MTALNILLIVLAVMLVLFLVRYLFTNPYTLSGVKDARTATTISASTLATSAGTGSNNFAYSVWFYVTGWNYRAGECKVLFGRTGDAITAAKDAAAGACIPGQGVAGGKPCPAVIFDRNNNNLNISVSCLNQADPITCIASNVPLQKWVNLVVSVYNRVLDVYIDGKLVKTCMLPSPVEVAGNADVVITPFGGFDGYTAKFQYFPNPINPQEAWNIYTGGYSNWYTVFNDYSVQVALLENGTTKSSVTF